MPTATPLFCMSEDVPAARNSRCHTAGSAETPRPGLEDRRVAEWLFLLAFIVYGYFYAGAGWNQNSQFDLTRAIVELHTFAIDAYASNTGDVARAGDSIYTNKSPGLSFMGVVPYAIVHAVEQWSGADPNDARVLAISHYLCSVAIVATLGALIPALLYLEGRRRRFSPAWCVTVALAIAFATQVFPYSTFFILHVPSGALMLAALLWKRDFGAGFCAGLATIVNYLCAPAIVAFAFLRGRGGAFRFIAGATPPLVALAAYQRICFGSFTTLSIVREDERFLTKGTAMGVFGWPSFDAFYGITLSPYRGLFYFAPLLLMCFAGMMVWFRRRERLPELVAIVFVSSVFFLFNIMFNGWEGGFGIGARYLVPVIPCAGLAILYCGGSIRSLVIALAVVSFVINFTASAVDPQPSGTIPRPLTQYLVPLLIHGHFSSDVPITAPWSAQTFTGHTSVNRLTHDEAVVFTKHPPGSPESEWSSFNLGEAFFGPGDARSLVPIALVITFGVAAVLRKARTIRSE